MNVGDTIWSWRSLPALLALAVLAHAGPAHAQLLDALGFQAQTQYDFSQVKRRGQSATGRGRLSTNYTLTLRRPFLPTSTLMSDLTFNATDSGDPTNNQRSQGWTLNMYANQSRYMLSGRMSRNRYNTYTTFADTSGSATDYNASLFLRQPSYPVVNLQFQRNVSGTDYAGTTGGYSTTSWMMGSSYDMSPLRFTVDRIRQNYGYSGSAGVRMNRQTAAVTMNHALMPGLQLTGELSRAATGVKYATTDTSTTVNRRVLRLSATPLRSLVADVALTSQVSDQDIGLVSGRDNDKSISWSVRSEILPGLSVDFGDQSQSLTGSEYLATRDSATRNRNVTVAARLTEDTVFNVSKTRTTYDIVTTDYHATQDALQSAVQTSLTPRTDLSVSYGKNKSATDAGVNYDSTTQAVTIRDRTSNRLSVGATYRHTTLRSSDSFGSILDQDGDAADLDLLWQPTYDMGLSMRLSYQDNTGIGASRSIAPSANLRWQIDRSTNLTANYSVQSFEQYDPARTLLFAQDTSGLSVRLTHVFNNGSNLDVIYGYQANSIADTEWRRQLRVGFTMVP